MVSTFRYLFPAVEGFPPPSFDPKDFLKVLLLSLLALLMAILFITFVGVGVAHASLVQLPGDDASQKLEAAGTLLKLLDTGLFQWMARIFSGVCIMSAAWALKEQRFGISIICVIGAIIFGTAPKWVKNIFDVGGNQGLFDQSKLESVPFDPVAAQFPELAWATA